MQRCLQLAAMGDGWVAPNPMVGAVLVHNDRIIGEGYHKKFGEAHAEVNCLASVKEGEKNLIPESVLYVSLEPCAHQGKTPPCADLIIENKIRHVVIGTRDPFGLVNGKGIDKLKAAGIQVTLGILENECRFINRRFFKFFENFLPYITLKWAETADGQIAGGRKRVRISNEQTNRLVHQWRSNEMAIMVGTNTALFDDPELNTRLWPGKSPLRLVLDMSLRLPFSLKVFNGDLPTVVFNKLKHEEHLNLRYYRIDPNESIPRQVLRALREMKVHSLLVEGGAQLLQTFINEGLWDEARVITNETVLAGKGIGAPLLKDFQQFNSYSVGTDRIRHFRNATTGKPIKR